MALSAPPASPTPDYSPQSLSPKTIWRAILVPFVVSRVLLFVLGIIARSKLPLSPLTASLEPTGLPLPLRIWARWDTFWYLQIAQQGYSLHPGKESNVAFFPLYPMLMRAGGWLFGQNLRGEMIAGLLISHIALLLSLYLLYHLTYREGSDHKTARRACVYLCIFPSTLFLGAVYPMSLGLLLMLAAYAVALGRNRYRWWWAGLLGGLAVLTRAEGILLLIPLAAEFITAWRQLPADYVDRPHLRDALGLTLMPVALGGWCLYLYRRFGDPLAFRTTLHSWSYGAASTAGSGHTRSLLDWAFLFFFLALLPLCFRRLRFSYALHAAIYATLLLALGVTHTVSFSSGMRYGLNLFPEFLILAQLGRRPALHDAWTIVSVGLASLFMVAFALFYWVA